MSRMLLPRVLTPAMVCGSRSQASLASVGSVVSSPSMVPPPAASLRGPASALAPGSQCVGNNLWEQRLPSQTAAPLGLLMPWQLDAAEERQRSLSGFRLLAPLPRLTAMHVLDAIPQASLHQPLHRPQNSSNADGASVANVASAGASIAEYYYSRKDVGHHSDSSSDPQRSSLNDFYLNVGKATQVLRDELPSFFQTGLLTTSIYSRDVIFTEPFHSKFQCSGIRYYRALAETLRVSLRCLFEDIAFEVVSVIQMRSGSGDGASATLTRPLSPSQQQQNGGDIEPDPMPRNPSSIDGDSVPDLASQAESTRVLVKWTFEARPRMVSAFTNSPKLVEYTGVFEYRFDAEGRIVEHRLQSIHPAPPIIGPCRWFRRPVSLGTI